MGFCSKFNCSILSVKKDPAQLDSFIHQNVDPIIGNTTNFMDKPSPGIEHGTDSFDPGLISSVYLFNLYWKSVW